MQAKNRLFNFDVLRVIGISLILYSHSTPYLGWSPRLKWLLPHPGAVGLSIFFFISGFLLKRSLIVREKKFVLWTFLKSRSIRIIPLYWIAIIVFIFVFHFGQLFHAYNFEPLLSTFFAHIFALQLFLYPQVTEIPTLWYMGALLPYYLMFAITARLSFLKFLVVNVLILGILYGLKLTLQQNGIVLMDTRLLLHYPTFLLGVCCAKLDLNLEFLKKRKLVLFVFFSVMAVAYLHLVGYEATSLAKMNLSSTNIFYYGYCLLWTIAFVSLAYLISPIAERFSSSVAFISLISYAIYLFHRPIYGIIYGMVTSWLSQSVSVRTIIFPVATLVLILISYYMTQLDAKFLKPKLLKLLNYRNSDQK